MPHKSGFVNIIGNPNVGKSTLLNQLVGEKLAIVTSKAQTTRHRILGIVNGDDFQVIFSDTPGIVKPAYKLHEGMMEFVKTAITDADLILYMTELGERTVKDEKLIEKLQKTKVPVFHVINKIDKGLQDELEAHIAFWKQHLPDKKYFPISAINGFGVPELFQAILNELPEHPPYFDKTELTDKPERFFVEEVVREKIFLNYKKEIPYATQVVVEEFKESEDIIRIRAVIFVERKSQKPILIGHKGEKIKAVGMQARQDLEKFFGKKIYLELYVKVDENWRSNELKLKKYGYLH
ncbi:MAG: GTPase Era [Bacteroidetes bacterium]|nr:MAG: GTPase Era [Bacteroidota bacterium]